MDDIRALIHGLGKEQRQIVNLIRIAIQSHEEKYHSPQLNAEKAFETIQTTQAINKLLKEKENKFNWEEEVKKEIELEKKEHESYSECEEIITTSHSYTVSILEKLLDKSKEHKDEK